MIDKTLEDDNCASTLINTSGCYTRFEEVYCIANKDISNDAMLDMFRVSCEKYSNKYTSALQKDDIDNYNKGNGAYKHPIFSKNLIMVRFPSRDNSKLDIARFFRYYPDKISEEIYSELKEECIILEKDNLTFNEALFILLGFNCVLAPDLDDYSINTSSHLIDKKLVRQSPGQELKSFFANNTYKTTKQLINFSTKNNKFLKLVSKCKTESVIEKDIRNNKICKIWQDESPFIGNTKKCKYITKIEVYKIVKTKLNLSIEINTIDRIIQTNKK